jgi:pilus assembly protein CpaE
MYPLPVVLVNVEDGLLVDIRLGLAGAMAEMEYAFPTVSSAIEGLRGDKNQARLLVVGPGADEQANSIRKLASALVGWPIIALVPGDSDRDTYLQVNRAGAAQVVPLPLDRDDFQSALIMISAQFGRTTLERHVFAVTSATGGSGATTIALNVASEIADQIGRSTILAEMSLQMGLLASLFDVTPRVTLAHLIQEIHRVDDLLVEKSLIPISDNLKLLVGHDKMHSLPPHRPEDLAKIVDCLNKLAEVTVLDMPGNFHTSELEAINAADQVVLVGMQSVPSIRALKLFREVFPDDRVNHGLWVVINRYNPALKGYNIGEIQQMLEVPRILTVANDYQAVSHSVNHGGPIRQAAPNSPVIDDIDHLVHGLLGLEKPERKVRRNGFMGRVFGSLAR